MRIQFTFSNDSQRFICNVNIRLHLKAQAVMQKYICGKIKELYIRLRICCGIDFFILFMMP